MSFKPIKRILSELLLSVDLHTGTHGGSGDAGADILALGGSGLGLDDSADESCIVLKQLLCAETELAQYLLTK